MRGENIEYENQASSDEGTSPRARGKPTPPPTGRREGRNIPACAGKTMSPLGLLIANAEHPRVRGENRFAARVGLLAGGTSPRARGKQPQRMATHHMHRNIPACAGKTSVPASCAPAKKEHPRVRGENGFSSPKFCPRGGTSPRARGKQYREDIENFIERNIPACAGKTTK